MYIILDDIQYNNAEKLVTSDFQYAIDRIAKSGGGTLSVPAGRYLLGALVLPSNFNLHLESGAELIASPNYDDFHCIETISMAEMSDRAFIYAFNKENISITGNGLINGSADSYFCEQLDSEGYRIPVEKRPRLVVFECCYHVTIHQIRVIKAPMWTVHLVCCQHVHINELTVDNDLSMANTDALDIDSCEDVWVSNSYFSSADDGICIKTTTKPAQYRRKSRHIVIQNCILRSYSCAIKLGTESVDDIEDVVVTNCSIVDSNRAIGLISRDGGAFRRLQFSHITFECHHVHPCHWGKSDPIYLSAQHRDPNVKPGIIEWVSFSYFTGSAEGAINIHSDIPGNIQNISFQFIQFNQVFFDSVQQGFYDVRPPCNPANPTGMGKDNAYCLDPQTDMVYGVEPYPDGLPVLYAQGTHHIDITNFTVQRPEPLPSTWSKEQIVFYD